MLEAALERDVSIDQSVRHDVLLPRHGVLKKGSDLAVRAQ
jgi:hypothetical protein